MSYYKILTITQRLPTYSVPCKKVSFNRKTLSFISMQIFNSEFLFWDYKSIFCKFIIVPNT